MTLTVLSVAYPFAAVGPDAVGGAEQILWQLDRTLVRAGHRSLVLACEGSRVSGTLLPFRLPRSALTETMRSEVHRRYRDALSGAVSAERIDLVHLHGIDCAAYLPPPGPPTLITLHLPPSWYPEEVFTLQRPQTWLHCVSHDQQASCPSGSRLLPAIENGVPFDELQASYAKRDHFLALGRICWEKGFHLALDAAREAGVPLVLAGNVFPYSAHRDYFERQIAPRLDRSRRFLGPVGFVRKRRLLTTARALLVPSLVAETSSLAAMEALACGTPIVAFRNGALASIVEHGKTGFLVGSAEEMAAALREVGELKPDDCREAARRRFSAGRMTSRYLQLYAQLALDGPVHSHADPHAA
ncbi:glycosyltransferase family 4 protein [Opitutaceae bacterium EW11]|nr:glycosyltransferase family 4 protein [Opitutaceae bacterium EW11]